MITDDALEQSVFLSNRYISDRFLPDKAVDVVDEAAAKVMLKASALDSGVKKIAEQKRKIETEIDVAKDNKDSELVKLLKEKLKQVDQEIKKMPKEVSRYIDAEVNEDVIADVVSQWTGIPISKLNQEETKRLLKMHKSLKEFIIGQDDAVTALVRAVKRSKVGLKDPKRPIGSFLFLGPTGVGKSELAKRLAEFLFEVLII